MQYNLNDLRAFVEVADANGYAPASRKTGTPRATLSRRVAALEARLGLKLIERSSRSFRLTLSGSKLYANAKQAIAQADSALLELEDGSLGPKGLITFAVAPSVYKLRLDVMVTEYLLQNTEVQIRIETTNRRVDLLRENFDFAIRAKEASNSPQDLVILPLLRVNHHFVAAPALAHQACSTLKETLTHIPALAIYGANAQPIWELVDENGQKHSVAISPRLSLGEMEGLKLAAIKGLGMTILPEIIARDALQAGQLTTLNFDLMPISGTIHAIHSGQKGMRPVVRHFLDWLGREYRKCTV